jgi:hypothetical protein
MGAGLLTDPKMRFIPTVIRMQMKDKRMVRALMQQGDAQS